MMTTNDRGQWTRSCPQCGKTLYYKAKAKRNYMEKRNKVCGDCNRSNVGRKNALTDTCPVCNETIRIPVTNTKEPEKHAAKHGMTLEELWLKKHDTKPPQCKCGCGEKTTWVGWWKGYSTFRLGHNANIYSAYDQETAAKIAQTRRESLTGKTSWALGLTKENDKRIRKRGEATSRGLQKAIKEGRLVRYNRFTDDDIRDILSTNISTELISVHDYKNCLSESIRLRCTRCDNVELVSLAKARQDRCSICDPIGSNVQVRVARWIESLIGMDVGQNVRGIIGKRELDIYIPSHQVAVEINGIYWHSEKHRGYKYHQEKTNACKALGIRLFHVFEDEWYNKREIVESMLSARLNMLTRKLMARKCEVVQLSPRERREFFNANHIDGDVQASKAWGLRNGSDLVAAVSLRRPFHGRNKDAFEVARSCNKLNTSVAGGTSKLISVAAEFARGESKSRLITYVDERFGGDEITYEQTGFQKTSTTPPRFWWTDGNQRFNRFRFRADRSRGMTEAQVAEEAGVVKIWGCANRTYELTL